MPDLRRLGKQLGILFTARARKFFAASMFVKLVLVIGASTLAAIAQSIELAHSNDGVSAWTVAGLAGAVLVAIGGTFVALTEQDASRALETARKAIEDARVYERQMNAFEIDRTRLSKEVRRGLELYNSMDVMRGAIEQCLGLPKSSEASIIQTCLSAASNSLVFAFDFKIEDTWTICIYVAESNAESGKVFLRCVAHERKIRCEISEARQWQEGVGVAGVSYSMGNEIIIPDLSAPDLGTVFNLKSNTRDHDAGRYRSMVAVPISVGTDKIPWGIAIVTTDKPNHFSTERSDGVATAEPIRAIAAMSALAVKAFRMSERQASDHQQKPDLKAISSNAGDHTAQADKLPPRIEPNHLETKG